jgi:hypothetical protein
VRNIGKREKNGEEPESETGDKLNDDVNDLFKLPLAEFTGARNTLSTLLKKRGLADDANLVKSLAKPSISAWTVNQLYWRHREAFDRLLAAGQAFREAQASGRAGKVADMRRSLDARRDALSRLEDLATSLLHAADHNATPDVIRRITTALEALSAHASLSADQTLGRLTQDVDPPGFESLASFIPDPATMNETKERAKVTAVTAAKTSQRSSGVPPNSQPKASRARDVRELEKNHQARLAASRVAQQAAKKALVNARAKAQRLEAAQKKAAAEVQRTAKELREAEGRLKKASAVSEAATQRAQSLAAEAEEAAKEVEAAERAVEETAIG